MREVSVVVSDPWSFVNEQGSNTFTAAVRATDGDLLLLELAGGLYVASPRGGREGYSLIPVTEERAGDAPPWGEMSGEGIQPRPWRTSAASNRTLISGRARAELRMCPAS